MLTAQENYHNLQSIPTISISGYQSEYTNILFDVIDRFFVIENRLNVYEFLCNNNYLFPLLIDFYFVMKYGEYFPYYYLSLDFDQDPDEPEYKSLVGYIFTKDDSKKAFLNYKEFRDKWWLENSYRAKGKFNFSIDFYV